jgi:hypothetical protein
VSSYVNAHDITLWGDVSLAQTDMFNLLGQLEGTTVPDALFDPAMYAATSGEDLTPPNKPQCQQSYVETYPIMLQPTHNNLPYHKFYYQIQQTVDAEFQKVLDALRSDPEFAENTIVIFTSDHGELLGVDREADRLGEQRRDVAHLVHAQPTPGGEIRVIDQP